MLQKKATISLQSFNPFTLYSKKIPPIIGPNHHLKLQIETRRNVCNDVWVGMFETSAYSGIQRESRWCDGHYWKDSDNMGTDVDARSPVLPQANETPRIHKQSMQRKSHRPRRPDSRAR